MNRRGFLGTLSVGLASLGFVWPKPRVTATETDKLLNAGVDRALCKQQIREFAALKLDPGLKTRARWIEDKIPLPAEDTLYFAAGVKDELLIPENPERWQAGDVWLNLDTREVIFVNHVFGDGEVQVRRAIGKGSSGATASVILAGDKLILVGNDGREFDAA